MSDDSRFGGSSGTPAGGNPADQDFGFFAGSAPVGAPSQFGRPPAQLTPPASPVAPAPTHPAPAQPAPSQFGPPPNPWAPAGHLGAPAVAGPQPYGPPPRGGLPAWAIVAICVPVTLVVLGILSAIAIPVFLNQRSTPVMPDSLGGIPRSTSPAMTEVVDEVRRLLSRDAAGSKVDAAGYGTAAAGYLLVAVNVRVESASEFENLGVTGGLTSFGDVQCGANAERVSMCLHTQTRGSVEVVQFGDGELSELATVTNEAWSAQPFAR